MRENRRMWRKETERKRKNRKELILTMFSFGTLLIALWAVISLGSLAQKAAGEDIQYIAFWHAPWQWLAVLLG